MFAHIFLLAVLLPYEQVFAINTGIGMTSGLMQQPSSQYYHYIYGAYAELGTDDSLVFSRATYFERPKFESAGFSDQEFGFLFHVGSKLTDRKKNYGIAALLGGGRIGGYIAASDPEDNQPMRRYAINGVSLGLEASLDFSHVSLALSHKTFMGAVSQEEIEADVAWPYNFFLLKLGMYI